MRRRYFLWGASSWTSLLLFTLATVLGFRVKFTKGKGGNSANEPKSVMHHMLAFAWLNQAH